MELSGHMFQVYCYSFKIPDLSSHPASFPQKALSHDSDHNTGLFTHEPFQTAMIE